MSEGMTHTYYGNFSLQLTDVLLGRVLGIQDCVGPCQVLKNFSLPTE